MPYRHTQKVHSEVVLTAEKAILDLYFEFSGTWDVEPETLLRHLKEISERKNISSPNHIVHILRMLIRNGHHWNMLACTVTDLQKEGAFEMNQETETDSQINPYENEYVKSEWKYPERYTPLSLEKQIEIFARYYPGLKMPRKPIVETHRSDGFVHMAVPKLSAVAKSWSIEDPFGRGYEAVIRRLSHVVQTTYRSRRFGFAKSVLDLEDFSQFMPRNEVREALMRLERQQPHSDVMMFHCQLGLRFRGSSMRRVEWLCDNRAKIRNAPVREFLLPAFVILNQLLIQPERLMNTSALGMYSAGDHVARKGFLGRDGVGFAFGVGVLQFLDYSTSKKDSMFGVPTGLVPLR